MRLWWGGAVWNCMRLLVGLVLTPVVERKFALVWVCVVWVVGVVKESSPLRGENGCFWVVCGVLGR